MLIDSQDLTVEQSRGYRKLGNQEMERGTILVMFLLLVSSLGCQTERNPVVPDALVGVWNTSAPRYSNRSFEITKSSAIFEHGGGFFDFAAYPITKVEKVETDARTLYVLVFMIPEGLEYEFSFYHSPANGGVIRFKNQEQIAWKKANHGQL